MLYDGSRIGEGMANGNEPATKADLNRFEEQLRSEFQRGCDHLAEAIHDSETRLLKRFTLLPNRTSSD